MRFLSIVVAMAVCALMLFSLYLAAGEGHMEMGGTEATVTGSVVDQHAI